MHFKLFRQNQSGLSSIASEICLVLNSTPNKLAPLKSVLSKFELLNFAPVKSELLKSTFTRLVPLKMVLSQKNKITLLSTIIRFNFSQRRFACSTKNGAIFQVIILLNTTFYLALTLYYRNFNDGLRRFFPAWCFIHLSHKNRLQLTFYTSICFFATEPVLVEILDKSDTLKDKEIYPTKINLSSAMEGIAAGKDNPLNADGFVVHSPNEVYEFLGSGSNAENPGNGA